MKPPNWMVITEQKWRDGHLVVNIRVRTWHPGFWWFVLRTLIERMFSK